MTYGMDRQQIQLYTKLKRAVGEHNITQTKQYLTFINPTNFDAVSFDNDLLSIAQNCIPASHDIIMICTWAFGIYVSLNENFTNAHHCLSLINGILFLLIALRNGRERKKSSEIHSLLMKKIQSINAFYQG